ncbi:MAG: YidC/Oxa1 family membrane protein insertase [Clostridia bacterium]|nr:YidC/Oxa1 family membrane protein insertase [Clostridia bacterium]
MNFLGFLAKPLGWLMWVVYEYIGFHNYFLTIFLFTLVTRIICLPLSLKNQKSMVDRARLAPRLERIQKKYAMDKQKLQQKQQELYEKEGVNMFGGCLPTFATMIILFGVIACIYSPLKYLMQIPENAVNASISAITYADDQKVDYKYSKKEVGGYYGEFRLLNVLEQNEKDIKASLVEAGYTEKQADKYYKTMEETKKEFTLFGHEEWSLLKNPGEGGWSAISLLWLLPLLAGVSQLLMTMVTMKQTKKATSAEMQQAQGCSNAMMYGMPLFSVAIGFTFPAGVSIYWICSSIVSVGQTLLLYKIYDPAKAREEAEREYKERRARRKEEKRRLAEARQRQDAAENAPDVSEETPAEIEKTDVTPDELEDKKKKK